MADRLKEIQILLQKRNARKRGPTSSDQFNDTITEIAHDLAEFNNQWNDRLVPLTLGLPEGDEGTSLSSVDAFTDGLDGKTLFTDSRATTILNSQYFNTPAQRPNTVFEQLTDVYTTIDAAIESLENQIADNILTASQISIADEDGLYSAVNVEDALTEVINLANSFNVFDLTAVTTNIVPSTDDTYDLGTSTLRWRDLYLGPASLHIVRDQSSDGGTAPDKDYGFSISTGGGRLEVIDDPDGSPTTVAGFSTSGLELSVPLKSVGLTTSARNALTPSQGMLIFNTSDTEFQGYDGSGWTSIIEGTDITGNVLTLGADSDNDDAGSHILFNVDGAQVARLNPDDFTLAADIDLILGGMTARILDSTGPLNLGDTASTGHFLVTGDVLIGDKLEVKGISYFESVVFIPSGGGLVVGHTGRLQTTTVFPEIQFLGTSVNSSVAVQARFEANDLSPEYHFVKSRNATINSHTIVQDNDAIGDIQWHPDDGVDFQTLAASFLGEVDDSSPAAGDIGMAFVWSQMPGGGGAIAETMRLTAAGDLEIADGNLAFAGSTARIFDSTGPLNLGDEVSTGHGLVTGDVLIGGDLEVDGAAFFDNDVVIANSSGLVVGNDSRIKTSTIFGELQYLGQFSSDTTLVHARFSDNNIPPEYHFVKSRDATIGNFTIIQNGDVLGDIQWHPDDGVDYQTRAAQFLVVVDDSTPLVGDIGVSFVWRQMAGDATASSRETMRLSAAGNLEIADGNLVFAGATARIFDSTGPLNLGGGSLTAHSLASGDVVIGGDLEVSGVAFFDSNVFIGDVAGMVIGSTVKLLTTALAPEFQLLGTEALDTSLMVGRFSADNGGPRFEFVKSRDTTIGDFTIVSDNDTVGVIRWIPDDGVDHKTLAATFLAEVDDASPAAGDIGMAFVWKQMPGGGGAIAETLRLTAAGDLEMPGSITCNTSIVVENAVTIGGSTRINTSGVATLQVTGTATNDSRMNISRTSDDNEGPRLEFVKSRDTVIGGFTIVQDNDLVGALRWYPDDGVDHRTVAAVFLVEVDDPSPAAGDIGMAFVWKQRPGGGGSQVETMRLDAAGVLTLAQGAINFPDTQVPSADVNTLDDYQEGTFTPIAIFAGGSGTITYSTQTGTYTKIGNVVFFEIDLLTSSIASRTGDMTIGGLPFTNAATFSAITVGFAVGLTITADQVLTGFVNVSATTIALQLWDGTFGTTPVQDTEWTDDGRVIISGHYRI